MWIQGFLIKIEVAGMYEKSIQLYQQGAISPLFLGGRGSGGMLPQNILRFQNPKNAISNILGIKLRTKECVFYLKKCTFHSSFNLLATQ